MFTVDVLLLLLVKSLVVALKYCIEIVSINSHQGLFIETNKVELNTEKEREFSCGYVCESTMHPPYKVEG